MRALAVDGSGSRGDSSATTKATSGAVHGEKAPDGSRRRHGSGMARAAVSTAATASSHWGGWWLRQRCR
eukprot:scaffold2047_cov119-Isochrysis_galbana.AAC.8